MTSPPASAHRGTRSSSVSPDASFPRGWVYKHQADRKADHLLGRLVKECVWSRHFQCVSPMRPQVQGRPQWPKGPQISGRDQLAGSLPVPVPSGREGGTQEYLWTEQTDEARKGPSDSTVSQVRHQEDLPAQIQTGTRARRVWPAKPQSPHLQNGHIVAVSVTGEC